MEPPEWPRQTACLKDVLRGTHEFIAQFADAWPKWWLTLVCLRPDEQDSWQVLSLEAAALFSKGDPETRLEFVGDHIFVASGPADFSDLTTIIQQENQPLQLFGIESELPPTAEEGHVQAAFLSGNVGSSRLFQNERRLMCASVTWRLNRQESYGKVNAWHEAVAVGYGAVEHLVAEQLGVNNYDTTRRVEIMAPLGLECSFMPEAKPRRVRLTYCRPFMGDQWRVLAPHDGKLRPRVSGLSADGRESAAETEGWFTQSVEVPTSCPRVWLGHRLLGRRLLRFEAPYDSRASTKPLETLDYLVAAVYKTGGSDTLPKAAERWRKQVSSNAAGEQELAIANALARLGFSVLFGGVWTHGDSADFIVVDHNRARAVLIDAYAVHKGTGVDAVRDKVAELQAHVVELSEHAAGWSITGIVVSTIDETQVPSIVPPEHVQVLTISDVEKLASFSRTSEAEGMLWPSRRSGNSIKAGHTVFA